MLKALWCDIKAFQRHTALNLDYRNFLLLSQLKDIRSKLKLMQLDVGGGAWKGCQSFISFRVRNLKKIKPSLNYKGSLNSNSKSSFIYQYPNIPYLSPNSCRYNRSGHWKQNCSALKKKRKIEIIITIIDKYAPNLLLGRDLHSSCVSRRGKSYHVFEM